ncbi:hypothetical protein C2E23DRAFT_896993 [Lenzites betulinus]|nr:hypothetical protein C2E23DRAFT_896993 [Lenzites betulinus]
MRFSLAVLALAFGHSFVFAKVAGDARTRAINIHALRHRAVRHGFHDDCLYLNSTSLAELDSNLVPAGLPSDLDACLCMSGLTQTLLTNVQLAYTVNTLGYTEAEEAFGLMIARSPQSQTCTYPDNSQPQCTRDNVCGFKCDSPFTAVGDTCVCADSDVCGALQLAARKTPPKGRLAKRAALKTSAEAQASCEAFETVCGKYEGIQSSFQCVDVRSNLEICGGCIVPSPFTSHEGSTAGVDCSTIPHAEDVACQAGRCAVRSCRQGWAASPDGTGCVAAAVAASLDVGAGASIALRDVPSAVRDVAAAGEGGVHYLWRRTGTRPEKNLLEEERARIPGVPAEASPEDVAEADRGGAHVAPKKIEQDWVRIPDYRR